MEESRTYNCMNPTFHEFYPSQSEEQGEKGVFRNSHYEEINSPTSLGTNGTMRRFEPWPSQKTIVTGINKKTKCCIATPILLTLLTGIVLGGVVAFTVITYLDVLELRSKISELNEVLVIEQDVADLLQAIQNLEQELNGTRERFEDRTKYLELNYSSLLETQDTLQGAVEAVQMTAADSVGQVERLRWFVEDVNTTQALLSGIVRNVTIATNTLANESNSELRALESSVNTLTSRLNSTLSPYLDCVAERSSCNLTTNGLSSYREQCATPALVATSDSYQTVDVRCEYEANVDYTESTVIHRHNNTVSCECDVTRVESTDHMTLPNDLFGMCTLLITRCPSTIVP